MSNNWTSSRWEDNILYFDNGIPYKRMVHINTDGPVNIYGSYNDRKNHIRILTVDSYKDMVFVLKRVENRLKEGQGKLCMRCKL